MRKILYFVLVILVVLPALVLAQTLSDPRGVTKDVTGKVIPPGYCFNILSQGAKGPEVEDLQEILKSDSEIYPEGLVTGYYGSLTKGAIEKLQKKFGLSQTGNVDEKTARIILPCPVDVQLTVLSPNGGEVWDRKDTHEITWKLSALMGTTTVPLTPSEIESKFFWPRGRIDLIKSDGTFVKHIATVDLAKQSYSWSISKAISNDTSYKIRIGLGPVIACPEEKICPLLYHPKFTFGDESDGPFTITGEMPQPPEKIQQAIQILQEAIQKLNKLLELLQSLL